MDQRQRPSSRHPQVSSLHQPCHCISLLILPRFSNEPTPTSSAVLVAPALQHAPHWVGSTASTASPARFTVCCAGCASPTQQTVTSSFYFKQPCSVNPSPPFDKGPIAIIALIPIPLLAQGNTALQAGRIKSLLHAVVVGFFVFVFVFFFVVVVFLMGCLISCKSMHEDSPRQH